MQGAASSMEMLIAGRAIAGLGGAGMWKWVSAPSQIYTLAELSLNTRVVGKQVLTV